MRFAIIAGEPSGDLLGAALMEGLKGAGFEGVGGEEMTRTGFRSIFPMAELSVMGIGEILPRIPKLLRRISETTEFVASGSFDALITIDSPDFSFRVAKRVRKLCPRLPIIHYVAPSVWAWRPKRAKKIAAFVDHVLCLLPFEPNLMTIEGMSADFVGHPISKQFEKKRGAVLVEKAPFVALFPGSRTGEVKRHMATYLEAWRESGLSHKLVICVHEHLRKLVEMTFSEVQNKQIISSISDDFQAQKLEIMSRALFAIATSGTVSFELAWAGTPTIVGYDANFLTRQIFKSMARVEHASLANILLKEEVIPEFLFENFTAAKLSEAMRFLDRNAEARAMQKTRFDAMRMLMKPELDAAQSVLKFMAQRQ